MEGCHWVMPFAPRCRLQGRFDWLSAQQSKVGTDRNFDTDLYAALKLHKYQVSR